MAYDVERMHRYFDDAMACVVMVYDALLVLVHFTNLNKEI